MSAQTFIGRMISLTSHSDIRYTGILEGIDQQNSTITLKNVFSLGTENRQPMGTPNYVPPNSTPYNHVVFKAQNVKDISVDDPQAAANIPNDPAVLSAASVPQYQASGYAVPAPAGPQQAYPQGSQQPTAQPPRMAAGQNPAAPAPVNGRAPRAPKTNGAPHVDQVTRSMNNVHIDNSGRSNGGGGGSRRNHPHEGGPRAVTVPDTDFDFQSSNARFNKVAPVPSALAVDEDAETKTNPSDSDSEDVQKKPGSAAERDKFYNPTKSFFDTLSTAAPGAPGAPRGGGGGGGGGRRGGGGRGGGGRGRNRREEEREKNVATFGEAGGVGILGPGAYVGGWGSGSQGRRRGGAPAHTQQQGGPGRR